MDEIEERMHTFPKLNSYFAAIDRAFKFIKAEDVAKALNSFVEQNTVKMVAVVPHEHALLERIFRRSVTKNLVFNSR